LAVEAAAAAAAAAAAGLSDSGFGFLACVVGVNGSGCFFFCLSLVRYFVVAWAPR
jgi:hypothetical protein